MALHILLSLWLASPAAAGPKPARKVPDPTAPTASTPAAVRTSSKAVAGSFHVSTAPPHSIQELMSHFRQIDQELKSLSAHFTQSLEVEGGGITQQTQGSVQYSKPHRLRIEHTHPNRQTIVLDGKNIWVYLVESNQVLQTDMDKFLKTDPMIESLFHIGNYSELLKKYDTAFDSSTLTATLRSNPKDMEGKHGQDFTLRLTLAGPYHFPHQAELAVSQWQARIRFENLRFNPDLDEGLFHFTPPEGMEVFSNFKFPVPGGNAQ